MYPFLASAQTRISARLVCETARRVAKQKQIKMQMQVGALAAIPQLESRTDEQLQSESKHRVAAKAILGARAAERYDAKTARAYFNEALAGCHPQERPALRQMMKASLALAERRPDQLRDGGADPRHPPDRPARGRAARDRHGHRAGNRPDLRRDRRRELGLLRLP